MCKNMSEKTGLLSEQIHTQPTHSNTYSQKIESHISAKKHNPNNTNSQNRKKIKKNKWYKILIQKDTLRYFGNYFILNIISIIKKLWEQPLNIISILGETWPTLRLKRK